MSIPILITQMKKNKKTRIIISILIILLILCSVLIVRALLYKPPLPTYSSSMAGYVSRYNPGHLSSAEAWDLFRESEDGIILDLRSKASYNERHVAGAVNTNWKKLENHAAKSFPDKNRLIICYCFCGDKGGTALAAYNLLSGLGYSNIFYTEPEDEWEYEGTEVNEENPGMRIISGEDALAIYEANPEAILLDVRSMDEFAERHIDGSILIPVDELEMRLSELPDKGAVIIVYCKAGVRSKRAYDILISSGYTNVYNMQKVESWPLPLAHTRF